MEYQDFTQGEWLYFVDGNVEILFRFLEIKGIRWVADKCYQVIEDDVYVSRGRSVITTSRQVVRAEGHKVDEILAKANNNSNEM